MSNRPGVGYHALHEIASVLLKFNLDETQADVPSALQHGTRKLPLGRYMQKNLRKLIGKDEKTPLSITDALDAEMFAVRLAARSSKENPSIKQQLLIKNAGKVAQIKARTKIFEQRKTI